MALSTVLLSISSLIIGFISWNARALAQNRAKAKTTNLPYLTRYISPINPIWLLYGSSFVRLCERLGIASKHLSLIYSFGWEANARYKVHEYVSSDVFLVAHPGGLQLCVADARVIYDILQRRTDFRRNMEEMAILNVYGENLSTTDGAEWQRHRRMTGVTFTEKSDGVVWMQSLMQAKGMLEYWTNRSQKPIRSTHENTKILTLNVLAAVLFDKHYIFEGRAEEGELRHIDDKSYMYRASLSTILKSIIQIFIFGEQGLKAWWTPKSWKAAAVAVSDFRSYILSLMNEERSFLKLGQTGRQHLVARLMRACEEEQGPRGKNSDNMTGGQSRSKKVNMTEEEIISNLFVYAFAGNDTTAIALTNLIVHLAANPQTQEWVAEELDHYLPDGDIETWDYGNFKKLKRCGAVIMETLRICHPLSQLTKTTGPTPQPLTFNGKTHMIPAGTSVHCCLQALNAHPKYWGPDPMAWNPKQHISSSDLEGASRFEKEVLAADTSDHFMPWAWGQRVCPGKRFSQVELVAVLAVLLGGHRVEVVPEPGETKEEARKRAWKTSLKLDHQGHMLHEMLNPQSIGLVWVSRGV